METFEGSGLLQCFGNIIATLPEHREEGDGTEQCRPVFECPDHGIPIAAHVFIADGADGSDWVNTLSFKESLK